MNINQNVEEPMINEQHEIEEEQISVRNRYYSIKLQY